MLAEIREATHALARQMQVKGLMNIQFAVKKEDERLMFMCWKSIPVPAGPCPLCRRPPGMPLAKIAAKVMAGVTLGRTRLRLPIPFPATFRSRKACFPFIKFPGVDIVLGPEMRSTGEVMGVSDRFSIAFAKSQLAAGMVLPRQRHDLLQRGAPHQATRGAAGPAAGPPWAFKLWPRDGTARTLGRGRHPGQARQTSCRKGIPTCSTI